MQSTIMRVSDPSLEQPLGGLDLWTMSESEPGSHRDQSGSLNAIVSTLIPALGLGLLLFAAFIFLRRREKRLYSPRTYLETLQQDEKTPEAHQSSFGWIRDFRNLPDSYILNHHSLDGYLFIRFFRLVVIVCFVGCCITWPLLLPVNAMGGNGLKQFDKYTFGNVKNQNSHYVHAIVACLFLGFVMFSINRESIYLINIRQAFLLSPRNASRISSRTVLFTSVPREYLNENSLRELFPLSKQIWYATDYSELSKLINKRDATALRLEAAEIELLRKANAKRLKVKSKGRDRTDIQGARYLEVLERPTHRSRPIIGEEVDTIDNDRRWLSELVPEIERYQAVKQESKDHFQGAVFIEFESQTAAQDAFTIPIYNQPKAMDARQIGVQPDEVIWENLQRSSWEVSVYATLTTLLICAMIVFWGIPVSLVGILSNIDYLADRFSFLRWLKDLPPSMLGLLKGLLPTVLLSALLSLVPIVFRYLAVKSGRVTLSQVELQIQAWYFAFYFIQVFLITTFTSGATTVVNQIASNPTSVMDLLAQNLPRASNFYLSYFVYYGLIMSSTTLVNLPEFFNLKVLGRLTASSPRKLFDLQVSLPSASWGSEYPKWVNLAVIAISYSCIAPLVLGFATIGFSLLYLAYRYNFLYVYGAVVDTKGAAYQKALQQMTVGVYVAELCLIGLFSLGIKSKLSAGPSLIMVVFLLFTAFYHVSTKRAVEPLVKRLPHNLLVESEEPYTDEFDAAENGDGHRAERINNIQALAGGVSKPSLWRRLVFPQCQSAANLAASLHPSLHHPLPPYPEDVARKAFWNPAITSRPPKLWIPRDELGISKKEIEATGKILPITDKGARLNEKNEVVLEGNSLKDAPIWEEKIIY